MYKVIFKKCKLNLRNENVFTQRTMAVFLIQNNQQIFLLQFKRRTPKNIKSLQKDKLNFLFTNNHT
jgi:mitochondrial fission protein ELM1